MKVKTDIVLAFLVVGALFASLGRGALGMVDKQHHGDEIAGLLRELLPVTTERRVSEGPGAETQVRVRTRLVEIAGESAESRANVIEALIEVLQTPPRRAFDERWVTAVGVLGELRATEAVDILAENLDQTGQNGILISLHFRPVAFAMARIGEPAIPRLIKALSDQKPGIRDQAAAVLSMIGQPAIDKLIEGLFKPDARNIGEIAFTLARIGGEPARKAIERAIGTETDPTALMELKHARSKMRRR